MVSSRGRYIWNEEPFEFHFAGDNTLTLEGSVESIAIEEAGSTLKEAFLAASSRCFPPAGRTPDLLMFQKPQYNTWMELQYDHSQKGIIAYAEAILRHGFPPGVLMIDDTWQEDYGVWDFHPGRFPNPAAMIQRLHEMGFEVMLWVCPLVSPDSGTFRTLAARELFIRDKETDEPAIRKWWNGYSALLDGSNPGAFEWMRGELDRLTVDYGIDGFKFDAGDLEHYRSDDKTWAPTTPHRQSEAWAQFGLNYALNEYRCCWKCAGLPLVQRLSDKSHSWDERGLGSLIPNAIAQGLCGHPFICPDMIGGGLQPEFSSGGLEIDQELFVRYAQCSALFPMMQFSLAPWRVLDPEKLSLCRDAARLHSQMGDDFRTLAIHAAATGEPILRCMEYEFPHEGLSEVTDQFMLGSEILVAPVLEKGAIARQVRIPKGLWRDLHGNTFTGPVDVSISVSLGALPWFRKC